MQSGKSSLAGIALRRESEEVVLRWPERCIGDLANDAGAGLYS